MLSQFFKDTKPGGQVLTLMLVFIFFIIITAGITDLLRKCGVDVLGTGFIWVQGMTQVGSFLFPALLVAVFFYDRPKRFLNLDLDSNKWLLGLAGAVVMLLCIPLSDVLKQWNDAWHLGGAFQSLEQTLRQSGELSEQTMENLLNVSGVGNLMVNLLVLALIPAVCEEFFFRGCLQNILQRWFTNPHIAILVTAAIFSLAHGEVFAFIPRFGMGVLLGYLFYMSGSMVVNVCANFANNAIVVLTYYLYNEHILSSNYADSMILPWWVVLIATVAASGVFIYSFVIAKNEKTT